MVDLAEAVGVVVLRAVASASMSCSDIVLLVLGPVGNSAVAVEADFVGLGFVAPRKPAVMQLKRAVAAVVALAAAAVSVVSAAVGMRLDFDTDTVVEVVHTEREREVEATSLADKVVGNWVEAVDTVIENLAVASVNALAEVGSDLANMEAPATVLNQY